MNNANTYFVREGQGSWTAVKAKTLKGAKAAASRMQMFQGTDLYIAERRGDRAWMVARKIHRDALNMSAVGNWSMDTVGDLVNLDR